jgi:NAD-dependent dihydropyrimidine dehydrogenase PreA subunit
MSEKKNPEKEDNPVAEEKKLEVPRIEVSADECKGCQLCVMACPKGVIEVSKEFNVKGFHPAKYVGEGCTGCGFCFYACPEPGAITVYKKGYSAEEE